MRFVTLFFMYRDCSKIHIGALIGTRIKECGMSYAEFARHLCVERTTVYNILRSKSIDTERLIRISNILNYDFLRKVYLSNEKEERNTLKIEVDGKEIVTNTVNSCELKISITSG